MVDVTEGGSVDVITVIVGVGLTSVAEGTGKEVEGVGSRTISLKVRYRSPR